MNTVSNGYYILIAVAGACTTKLRRDLERIINRARALFGGLHVASGEVMVPPVLIVKGGPTAVIERLCKKSGLPYEFVDGWDERTKRAYCLWGGRSSRVREVYQRGIESGCQFVTTFNQGKHPFQMLLPLALPRSA